MRNLDCLSRRQIAVCAVTKLFHTQQPVTHVGGGIKNTSQVGDLAQRVPSGVIGRKVSHRRRITQQERALLEHVREAT